MRRAGLAVVFAAVALAACRDDGYVVELTVNVDARLADPSVIDRVVVAVSGADTGSYALEQPFAMNPYATARQERLVYHPFARAGTLTFAVTAYHADSEVAHGQHDVALKPPATATATIVIAP